MTAAQGAVLLGAPSAADHPVVAVLQAAGNEITMKRAWDNFWSHAFFIISILKKGFILVVYLHTIITFYR